MKNFWLSHITDRLDFGTDLLDYETDSLNYRFPPKVLELTSTNEELRDLLKNKDASVIKISGGPRLMPLYFLWL